MIKSKKGIYISDFITVLDFFVVLILLFIFTSTCSGDTTQSLIDGEHSISRIEAQVKLRKVFETTITEAHLEKIETSSFDNFESAFLNKNLSEGIKAYIKEEHLSTYNDPVTKEGQLGSKYDRDIRNIIYALLGEKTFYGQLFARPLDFPTNVVSTFPENTLIVGSRIIGLESNSNLERFFGSMASQNITLNQNFILEVYVRTFIEGEK